MPAMLSPAPVACESFDERAPGRGKRGGYRIIYFARLAQGHIWMLTIYPKNVAENIPAHILRQIRKEVEDA